MSLEEHAPTLQELIARLNELEQTNSRMGEELANMRSAAQGSRESATPGANTQMKRPGSFGRAMSRKNRGRRGLLRAGFTAAAATVGTSMLLGMNGGMAEAKTDIPGASYGPSTFNNNGQNIPAITANSSNKQNAIIGTSSGYTGISGKTTVTNNGSSGVYGQGPNVGVSGQVIGAIPKPVTKVAVYGAGSNGTSLGAVGVQGDSDNNSGVLGTSVSSNGVLGSSVSYTGVAGKTQSTSIAASGVYGLGGTVGVAGGVIGANTLPPVKAGVYGTAANQQTQNVGGVGVYGQSDTYYGVSGTSTGGGSATDSAGVAGFTTSTSSTDAGVLGEGINGVVGLVTGATRDSLYGDVGVYGSGSNGSNLNGTGVQGVSDNGTAVWGETQGGIGVYGYSSMAGGWGAGGYGDDIGVYADSNNTGIYAYSNNTGIYAYGTYRAGVFGFDVDVNGNLTKSGGSFKIDHPADPANKYLYHSFVESPDMKNVYDGVVVLDATGQATVTLPSWFDALNTSFRYLLTPVGAPGPDLHIVSEISSNAFTIGGGTSGMKVCWQVTGIRQDPWAKAHPIPTEVNKSATEQGHYLHPELYGHPSDPSIVSAPYQEKLAKKRLPKHK